MAMSNVPPALELRGVDMHYGYVRALDAIDIHVTRARCWGWSATTAPASPACSR